MPPLDTYLLFNPIRSSILQNANHRPPNLSFVHTKHHSVRYHAVYEFVAWKIFYQYSRFVLQYHIMAPSKDPKLDEMISAWIKSNKDPKHLHPNDMDDLVKRLRAWVVRAKEHREKHYTSTAAKQANQLEMIELMRAPITPHFVAQKPAKRQEVTDIMRGMQVNFQDLIWNY